MDIKIILGGFMKKLLLFLLIVPMAASAQTVTSLVNNKILGDQQRIKMDTFRINQLTQDEQNAQNEMSTYNADLPLIQAVDKQIQTQANVIAPVNQNG